MTSLWTGAHSLAKGVGHPRNSPNIHQDDSCYASRYHFNQLRITSGSSMSSIFPSSRQTQKEFVRIHQENTEHRIISTFIISTFGDARDSIIQHVGPLLVPHGKVSHEHVEQVTPRQNRRFCSRKRDFGASFVCVLGWYRSKNGKILQV